MLSTRQHVSKSLASLATFRNLALVAALLAVITALTLVSTTAQATGPDPVPSDYRVIWARHDLGFLSYKNSNEANQGNEYPSGSERSITLPGLTKGATFKVRARARYTSGGDNTVHGAVPGRTPQLHGSRTTRRRRQPVSPPREWPMTA